MDFATVIEKLQRPRLRVSSSSGRSSPSARRSSIGSVRGRDVRRQTPSSRTCRPRITPPICFCFRRSKTGFRRSWRRRRPPALPDLTTAHGAGLDIVTPGQDGWIVPVREPAAIVDRLIWCGANRADRRPRRPARLRHVPAARLAQVAADFEAVCLREPRAPVADGSRPMSDETLRSGSSSGSSRPLLILARHWRGAGAGLVFTYVLTLAVMHWLAPLIYLLPWYDNLRFDLTAEGLRQSTFAILGFAAGGEVTLAISATASPGAHYDARATPVDRAARESLPVHRRRALRRRLPAGRPAAERDRDRLDRIDACRRRHRPQVLERVDQTHAPRVLWAWLAATMTLPLVTVLGQGFLGYGFAAMLTVSSRSSPAFSDRAGRWSSSATVLGYLGLSVYVTYMRDRRDIREVVWSGASVQERAGPADRPRSPTPSGSTRRTWST